MDNSKKSNGIAVRFMSSQEDRSSQFESPEEFRRGSGTTSTEATSSPIEENEFERTAISCFRVFIFLLMVASTISAGVVTLYLLNKEEEDDFRKEVSGLQNTSIIDFAMGGRF